MQNAAGALLCTFAWLVATAVGSRLALWASGRDRWARRGDMSEWAVRVVVAVLAAHWVGWL